MVLRFMRIFLVLLKAIFWVFGIVFGLLEVFGMVFWSVQPGGTLDL